MLQILLLFSIGFFHPTFNFGFFVASSVHCSAFLNPSLTTSSFFYF